MPDQRLRSVYDAASVLFVKKGYSNTQVSQIADEAKIATGSIYNLFAGKKAILDFVLISTFDKQHLDRDVDLPVREVDSHIITRYLTEIGDDLFMQIDNLEDGAPVQTFPDMLSSLFDCAAYYQVAFNIINDNKDVLREAESQYRRYVDRLYRVVKSNLLHYIERGEVRPVELPELHIRNILEGITWWAMYLPYQYPGLDLTVVRAKSVALDILKHAYMTKAE